MEYKEKTVLSAFELYSMVAAEGSIPKADWADLYGDEEIRSLAQIYAENVQ